MIENSNLFDGLVNLSISVFLCPILSEGFQRKTLLQEKGKWKLHSVISFWDYDYKYSKSQVNELVMDSGF